MCFRLLTSVALSLLAWHAAFAEDRPVTDEERAKLAVAMQAEGCTGGAMEFDDGRYEVDDARCSDGRAYDLKFDTSFKVIEKVPDDD